MARFTQTLLMLVVSAVGVLLFRTVLDRFDRLYSSREAEARCTAWLNQLDQRIESVESLTPQLAQHESVDEIVLRRAARVLLRDPGFLFVEWIPGRDCGPMRMKGAANGGDSPRQLMYGHRRSEDPNGGVKLSPRRLGAYRVARKHPGQVVVTTTSPATQPSERVLVAFQAVESLAAREPGKVDRQCVLAVCYRDSVSENSYSDGSRVGIQARNLTDKSRAATPSQTSNLLLTRKIQRAGQTYEVQAHESPRRVQRRSVLAMFGILLGPIFFASHIWVRRQRKIKLLESEKNQLLGAVQELEDIQRTLQVMLKHRDREQRLVANEIHDGFMQEVMSARMFLEGLAARLPDGDKIANKQLNNALQLVDSAVGEGRQLVSELKPLTTGNDGLIPALQRLADLQKERFGLSVALRYPPGLRRVSMPSSSQHTLYRIAQEALSNVRRHSGAKEALVALRCDAGTMEIEVIDHGRGFQPNDMSENSFGVRGIYERARLNGGHASIRSKLGQGTLVSARLPVDTDGTADDVESTYTTHQL